jgi:hypothetical protein
MTDRDPMTIVQELTDLPHRGTGTPEAVQARAILTRHLDVLGAAVSTQSFRTPRTYVSVVSWMIGGLIAGLLLLRWQPWVGFALTTVSTLCAWLFFDLRYSPAIELPPRVKAGNVIGVFPASSEARKRLILMAHFDSAPASLLYRPEMVKGFVRSLRISIGLTLLAVIVALLVALGIAPLILVIVRWALIVYFVGQIVLGSLEYFRLGFVNGASDNATGVAAAVEIAARVRQNLPGDWEMQVVLTSAEENNGMVGARTYYRTNRARLGDDSYILNIDTVGMGALKIITATGTLTNITYDNALVEAAKAAAQADPRFADVETAEWRTGDFDTAPFARGGVPCLTLGALDAQGGMPNIHRPEDTITNVDPALVRHTVDFGVALVKRLIAQES